MNDILLAMRERALMDSAFRKAILATAENPDPLAALLRCRPTKRLQSDDGGYHFRRRGVFLQSTKSTNGGNPMPYDCFDDSYDMFILSLR